MSMTPLGSPVVPLENGSATTWRAGSIAGLGAGVPGAASRASNGVVPAAPPNVKTSSTPAMRAASTARSASAGAVTRKRAPAMRSCNAASAAVYSPLMVVFVPPARATP